MLFKKITNVANTNATLPEKEIMESHIALQIIANPFLFRCVRLLPIPPCYIQSDNS